MNTYWLRKYNRFISTGAMIFVLLVNMAGNITTANAESSQGLNGTEYQVAGNQTKELSTLSSSGSCGGPTIYLSGETTSRYSDDSVTNGTTFDRTAWYSDAVGNGTNVAFSVGNGTTAPYDVCVLGGVINGHIPLDWTWSAATSYGGGGDKTYTAHLVLVDGARVHAVVDGWKPRELPEFGNTGIMQMRNTYMTGIRDDSIENDDFMPGLIENSLFDGVRTFLSEQNQSGGTPVTIGPSEDPYIRLNQVYVRLYPTNSSGTEAPGRWIKFQPLGTVNHTLVISDSVFAAGMIPKGGWSALEFPAGTIFQGTNYVLWLGTPGTYDAAVPPGVIFLDGQAALDKWNQVRNTWLTAHGYSPRPADDLNPMDDPVIAPASMPSVSSIVRLDADPTNVSSVSFRVTFTEAVTGVDVNDFHLTTQGVTGVAFTGLAGSGSTYTVTVNTGTGSGTIRLDLIDNDSIWDGSNNPLGGVGTGNGSYTLGQSYTLDRSSTFLDVHLDYWAWDYVERLYDVGVTSGCSLAPLMYCPAQAVTRDQMAVFLLHAKHGSSYIPPTATGVFQDVSASYWAANWIEELAAEGITSGCSTSPELYCPTTGVTRDQMAIFLLRGKYGPSYVPPKPTGIFKDVPTSYWAADWIEQLAAEGITGGCGNGNYCPTAPVTRDQMAVFLVRNFSLP